MGHCKFFSEHCIIFSLISLNSDSDVKVATSQLIRGLSFVLQPNNDPTIDAPTVGKAILKSRGLFTGDWGSWLSIGAVIGFTILFNILYLLSLTYLNREYHYFLLAQIIVWCLSEQGTYTLHMLCFLPASSRSNALVSDKENESGTNKEQMSEASVSSTMPSSIPMGEIFNYPS